eukprot:2053241-Pleurochrysis_carterae.AAC.2
MVDERRASLERLAARGRHSCAPTARFRRKRWRRARNPRPLRSWARRRLTPRRQPAEIEEIDEVQLRTAAGKARKVAGEELAADSQHDTQPSVPPALDEHLIGRSLEVRWRYILSLTLNATKLTPAYTYV